MGQQKTIQILRDRIKTLQLEVQYERRQKKVTQKNLVRHLGLAGSRLDIYRARLRIRKNPVILECGANNGEDTVKFLDRWPRAEVFCFEPEPRAAAEWRNRVKSPRAHLFEVAIAEKDGESMFYRSSGQSPFVDYPIKWNQSGSIRRPTGHIEEWPWVKFEEEMKIQTRSLDSWARENGIAKVDLIWADVQGSERDLIMGGKETLSNTKYFYTELSDKELYEGQTNLRGIMLQLPGWSVLKRFPSDVLIFNETN